MGSSVFEDCDLLQEIYVPFRQNEMPNGWESDWQGNNQGRVIFAV
jgi:hypothetical protein